MLILYHWQWPVVFRQDVTGQGCG